MAETIKGINVVIGSDTTGLSNALSDVNKKSRDIQSELKQVEKLLKLDPTNTELLAQKQKLLSDAVANTRDKLDRLRAAQQQVEQQFKNGEITEGQYRAFQREVASTEQELKRLDGQLDNTNESLRSQGVAVSKLGKDYKESFDQAKASMGNTFEQLKKLGAAVTAGGLAIGTGLGFAVKGAADFEQGMANVYSVMDPAEVSQFQGELKKLAIVMGADTKYSATEAAQGIEELVKAGVSVKDIMSGGLQGALSLATAGELELGDAAEIASTALNAFRDDNISVQRAADLLAGAANASATSVSEMKFGLSQVSAVASSVGMSFKDTNTALAVFAQNGLKGSDAGTSLKTMLSRLQPMTNESYAAFNELGLMTLNVQDAMVLLAEKGVKPASDSVEDVTAALEKYAAQSVNAKEGTAKANKAYKNLALSNGLLTSSFYDQTGSLKDLNQIADILKTSMTGLTDAQRQQYMYTLFGSDAIRAGNILFKEGAQGVDQMAEAIEKIKADDVAAQKMNTFKGTIEQLSGSMETAMITIGDSLLPALRKLTDFVSKAVDVFNDMPSGFKSFIAISGAVVAALLLIIGPLLMLVGFIPTIMAGFSVIGPLIAGAFSVIMGPVGLVIAAIAAVAAGAYLIIKNWEAIRTFFTNIWNWLDNFLGGWAAEILSVLMPFIGIPMLIAEHWDKIKEFFSGIWDWIKSFFAEWGTTILTIVAPFISIPILIAQHWDEIKAYLTGLWDGVTTYLTGVWDNLKTAAVNAFQAMYNLVKPIFDGFKTFFSGVWEAIKNTFLGAILLIVDLVTGDFESLSKDSQAIWNNLKEAFGKIWEGIKQIFSGTLTAIKTVVSEAWNGMKSVTTSIITSISNWIKNTWDGILNWFRELPGKLYTIGTDMFTKMREAVTTTVTTVKDAIIEGVTTAIDWLKQLPSQMVQIGKDMIQGLVNGIKNMAGAIGDAVKGIADKITGGIRSALDIHSPSRVMRTLGEYTGEGFAIGIGNTISSIKDKASDIAAAATAALKGAQLPSVNVAGVGTGGAAVNQYDMNGFMSGAVFNVRKDDDIKMIAKEIWNMSQQAQRGSGGGRG